MVGWGRSIKPIFNEYIGFYLYMFDGVYEMDKIIISRPKNDFFYLGLILLFTMPYGLLNHNALAREYFNPAFLTIGGGGKNNPTPDLSVFNEINSQAPGKYRVDVWLNNSFIETREFDFSLKKEGGGNSYLSPCISLDVLKSYGLKVDSFPNLLNGEECVNINGIPQAKLKFNFNNQRLLMSIPQIALYSNARGYISPDQYDKGITALLLNYRFFGSNNYSRNSVSKGSNNQYLNLRSGLNVGEWRLRNYAIWNRDSEGNKNGVWNNVYTYLQRNIVALKAQLTLGDSSTPGDVFDSVPFRGAQLASDDTMLPESLRGYAPVVRGTARSNAEVTIRQNGYIIYQTYVAAGAFVISDMFPTGGSGDLNVTIKESDGSEQHLVVPFSSVPNLKREGQFKFSITSGKYRPHNSDINHSFFTQLVGTLGIPWGMTIYGGTQQASKYQSLALGTAKNLGSFGALSVDVIQAWAKIQPRLGIKDIGQSWRIRYSKNFVETGTNFAIAGYRYSTHGFYSMSEVLDTYSRNFDINSLERRRNRTELTLNQNLGQDFGSLSLSLLREEYWRNKRRLESISASYNNSWDKINYSINYSYNRNSSNLMGGRTYDKDQVLSLNINIPLDKWLSNTWVNYSTASSKPGTTSQSIGIGGTALENNNLNWSVQQGYTSQGIGNSGNIDSSYRGTYGEVTMGYGYDRHMNRLGYGVEGGVLIHEDGITLSQPFGDTAVLVSAPGANGVNIYNRTGVKTDFRGYTVVPNVTPYRKSDIFLDTTTLPDNVDLEQTTKSVIPNRGAIVRANFAAQVGYRIMMSLKHKGIAIPFGAIVTITSQEGNQSSIVGDSGQVYLYGLPSSGALLVQWGKGEDEKCTVNYQLPIDQANNGIYIVNENCI